MGFQAVPRDADGLEAHPTPVGPLTAARKVYQQAFDIAQRLAAADPTDARALRDLSVSFNKLGDVQRQSGQVTEALRSYEKCLEIRQKLAAADPTDARALRDLSVSFDRLGDVQLQSGQVTEALRSYEKALEIRQKLAAADPTDARALRGLSISFEKLGDVQLQSGQVTEALRSYEKLMEIRQKLAAAAPSDAQAQIDLHVAYDRIGGIKRNQKQYQAAIASYENSLAVIKKLDAVNRLSSHRSCLARLEREITECEHLVIATNDWKTLLEQPLELLPALLDLRGTELIQAGRIADAVQVATKLRELGTATAEQLYNAGRVFSLSAGAIKPDGGQELTAEQSKQRQHYRQDALATLKQALAAGWKDFEHMQKDNDLKPLRGLPEFEALFPKKPE